MLKFAFNRPINIYIGLYFAILAYFLIYAIFNLYETSHYEKFTARFVVVTTSSGGLFAYNAINLGRLNKTRPPEKGGLFYSSLAISFILLKTNNKKGGKKMINDGKFAVWVKELCFINRKLEAGNVSLEKEKKLRAHKRALEKKIEKFDRSSGSLSVRSAKDYSFEARA